jgi:hypothetical protein
MHLRPHHHLDLIDEALRELLRIFRDIGAVAAKGEVQERRRLARLGNAIGGLALDRHFLEIGRHLGENEGFVDTRRGHDDQGGRRREIPEGQARTFTDRLPILVLDHILGRLCLDETQSEHVLAPVCAACLAASDDREQHLV